LTTDQEYEQRDGSPKNLLLERDAAVRGQDLWQDAHDWLDEIEKPEVSTAHL